jgi:hypothetical protein
MRAVMPAVSLLSIAVVLASEVGARPVSEQGSPEAPRPIETLLWEVPADVEVNLRSERAEGASIVVVGSRKKESVQLVDGIPRSETGVYYYQGTTGVDVVHPGGTATFDSFIYPLTTAGKSWGASGCAPCRAIVDGRKSPTYANVGPVGLSRDGAHAAYAAQPQGSQAWVLVKDGVEGRPLGAAESAGMPEITADGRHAAVKLKRARKNEVMFLDDRESAKFEEVGDPTLSHDGARLAFPAKLGKNRWVMVLDGQPGAEFEAVLFHAAFSPDAKRFAYAAWRQKTIVVIVDGQIVKEVPAEGRQNFLYDFTYSPDGRRLAYVVAYGGLGFVLSKDWNRESRAKMRMFVDGKEGKEYDVYAFSDLTFSKDGQHFAYAAHGLDKVKSFVVLDGVQKKLYDGVARGSVAFEGDALAYVARDGRKILRLSEPLGPLGQGP